MPLFKKIDIDNHSVLALWKIDEDVSFFEREVLNPPHIPNEKVRLQWYASRHVINELSGSKNEILKDDAGKPYLKDSTQKISLSHTQKFAAGAISRQFDIGIDIETVNSRVERIAHKFLTEEELDAIAASEKIEKLILYWSAKEALYKFYGKGYLDFKTQLLIKPFEIEQQGKLIAEIVAPGFHSKNLELNYGFFDDHVLTYVVGR